MTAIESALDYFSQPLEISRVKTVVIDFKANTFEEKFSFEGVWQPFAPDKLMLRPEGERNWSWFNCHSKKDLEVKVNDIVIYKGKNYRVMEVMSWSDYGYYEYNLIEDYVN